MAVTNGFIKINGVVVPYPSTGLTIQRQQLVDSARNAQGQVVAQKINRRINKIDNLQWKYLTASQWRTIQLEVDKFSGILEFWDNVSNSFKTIQVYWGDEQAEPFRINPSTGEVLSYINCKCNLIDMGY